MSGENTFSVSQLMGSLGVKGGQLPRIEMSTYQPVLVMGDFSKTLASEPLEARAIAAEMRYGLPGKVYQVGITSMAPGGIIIEGLVFAFAWTTVAALFVSLTLLDDPNNQLPSANWENADIVPIGGLPARSRVYFKMDVSIGGLQGATLMAIGPNQGKAVTLSGYRIYVPPGHALFLQSGHVETGCSFEMVWRELPDPIGTP